MCIWLTKCNVRNWKLGCPVYNLDSLESVRLSEIIVAIRQGHHVNHPGTVKSPFWFKDLYGKRSLRKQNPSLWCPLIPLSSSGFLVIFSVTALRGPRLAKFSMPWEYLSPSVIQTEGRRACLVSRRDPSIVHLMLTAFFVMKNGIPGCMDHTA